MVVVWWSGEPPQSTRQTEAPPTLSCIDFIETLASRRVINLQGLYAIVTVSIFCTFFTLRYFVRPEADSLNGPCSSVDWFDS